MLTVGIDLGTTYSLAAYVSERGVPTLIPDRLDASEFRTPSVVHVGEAGCLVGQSVEVLLDDEPGLPHARHFKLAMGENRGAYADGSGREWWPPALSALVLRKLMQDIEAFANEPVQGVVITVPANFDDAQRRATRDAAMLAGIGRVKLMDEPVAAATYYGFSERDGDQTLFVYDLGGGTFDATVLQSGDEGLFALATSGNRQLGGKWVDDILADYVLTEFERQHGHRPADAASRQQVRRFAEDAKLQLSRPGKNRVSRTLLVGSHALDFVITQDHFDQLIDGLVGKTLEVCAEALERAGLSWGMVDKVLLTGGSSLLPLVTRKLAAASGKSPESLVCRQPHQAVAFGAALLSRQVFSAAGGDTRLQSICSHDLGIRAVDPKTRQPTVKVLVGRNTPLPARARTTFFTTRDDQRRMIFEVVQAQGEGEERIERSLGHFAFGPITQPRRNYPVEAELGYDLDGMVTVRARDPATGDELHRELDRDAQSMDPALALQRDWIHRSALG